MKEKRRAVLLAFLVIVGTTACVQKENAPTTAPRSELECESERVVMEQVNAYNQHDLEAFVETYAPDARFYAFPDTLISTGHADIRRVFSQLFPAAPELKAAVTERVVNGRIVVLKEVVTGGPQGTPTTDTVIYEVVNGKISRVWFITGGFAGPQT